KASALPAREVERTELSFCQAAFCIQPELPQQPIDLPGVRIGNAIESVEEMIVKKYPRHQGAVFVPRLVADQLTVETDLTRIGRIQPREHPQESRFAGTVAAGDEDEFAGMQAEIDRPDLERCFGRLVDITKLDACHFYRIKSAWRCEPCGVECGRCRLQLDFQMLDPVCRSIGVQQDRDCLNKPKACAHDEHQSSRGLCERQSAQRFTELRRDKNNRADQDIHGYLRGHDELEGFRLTVDLDVGCGSRDLAGILEEVHAARRVEPHLLESVEEVSKAIEQADFPSRRLLLFCRQAPVLVMKDYARNTDDHDCGYNRCQREKRHIDRHKENQHCALNREAKHIACLCQDGRIAGDGGYDARTTDRLERQNLRSPDVIHYAQTDLVNDGFDL